MAADVVLLSFKSMEELDKGRVGKVLQKHIQTIMMDCVNRPCDAQLKPLSRKLQFEFVFTPELDAPDEFGNIKSEKVLCEIKMQSKLPTHVSAPIQMRCTRSGMIFNRDFPRDVDGQSLFAGMDDSEDDEDESEDDDE